MRIIFMGTPEFAVYSLDALVEAGHQVELVITQEDKPKDRGKKIQMPSVKQRALELGIKVYQPKRIKDEDAIERIRELAVDLIVVTAYGQIIPKQILELPKFGCINVHASLLPKYRGAAPIQFAVINGEQYTGITTMKMEEGLDTGDMIFKDVIPISIEDNYGTLHDKLAVLSKKTLVKTLAAIEKNEAVFEKQDNDQSSYAPLIQKSLGHIDFSQKPDEIVNLIRGLDPWPSAFATLEGQVVKLWNAVVGVSTESKEFGKIKAVKDDYFEVVANGQLIQFYEIQFPNKKRVKVKDYLRGNRLEEGIFFK